MPTTARTAYTCSSTKKVFIFSRPITVRLFVLSLTSKIVYDVTKFLDEVRIFYSGYTATDFHVASWR